MKKRILIKVFRILLAGLMLVNFGCAAAVGSAIGYGIGTITGGLEAGKGADTNADCPSCIKVQNMEEAKRIRDQLRWDAYSRELPQQQPPPQNQ
ncbi:MAG: hypothetical protein M1497_00990 [Nitrospirae bacterium]|jgi:hypothetical protein|nr:hypothetical protein [Nitrospirota bacterium]